MCFGLGPSTSYNVDTSVGEVDATRGEGARRGSAVAASTASGAEVEGEIKAAA